MKILLKGVFLVILGYVLGYFIFKSKLIIIKSSPYYFLEEENYNDINSKIYASVDYSSKNINIYRGITMNYKTALSISEVLKRNGINTQIRVLRLSNKEFSNMVREFDLLINMGLSDEDILKVERVILEKYEKNNKKNLKFLKKSQ